VARTAVTFRAFDEDLLESYVATEEWRGRSGGYAIQGAGSKLALSVDGEEENVVGLPLEALRGLYPEVLGGR
jgi:septum formation protein